MAARTLNQLLAVEKAVRGTREDAITKHYQRLQKPELSAGRIKTYTPKDENGETQPPDSQKVQLQVELVLQEISAAMREIFNLTATKDVTNCSARADIVIDGKVIAKSVPVTHLLWLEKKLGAILEIIRKVPILPADTTWTFDAGSSLHRSESITTVRTKKVETYPIIVPGTDKHPAQTAHKTEDQVVGTWNTVHLSGAITEARRNTLLTRCEQSLCAVKEAREEANRTVVDTSISTSVILDLLFAQ